MGGIEEETESHGDGTSSFRRALVAWGQVVFYGLAALDPLVPDHFPLKELTSPIRTFVVLMAASLAAVQVYFVSPTSLWKEASYRSATAEPVAPPSESPEPKVPTSSGA